MLPDDPRHGTYKGSQAHYRYDTPICEPCRIARNHYNKRLEVDHARGIKRRTSPSAAARHAKQLHDAGMPYPEIARRAGVSKGTVYRVVGQGYQTPPKMEARKLAAILAVRAGGETPPTGYVPRFGAARRIQALNAIGWPRNTLADRLGMSGNNLTQLVNGCRGRDTRPNEWVQAATWHKIANLYDELHMTPGPSTVGRNWAARKGWATPLAWDDIDDPAERPSVPTWYDRMGKRARGSLVENWGWLRESGVQIEEAAERLGVTVGAIEKACDRAGAA